MKGEVPGGGPGKGMQASALSDIERVILEIERLHPGHDADKDELIRRRTRMSAVRYYRMLSALIDAERAVAFDPLLVGRLRRSRDDARRRHRTGR